MHYEEAARVLKAVHTPRPDRYSIGWFYGDVIDNRLRFIKERLIEVQFLQPPESGFLDEWGCKHPKPEEFLELTAAIFGRDEESPSSSGEAVWRTQKLRE